MSKYAMADVPVSIIQFLAQCNEHNEWLDGPETTQYVRPDEVTPGHKSSDRALAAYEDGHPSYVTWTDWNE